MGQVRTAVRAYGHEGHEPSAVMGLVHDLLRSFYGGEQMVTMLYVVVDPLTLEARVVNAGHPPPLILEPDGEETFLDATTGLPLGLSWDMPYEESIARLRPGTTLLLYTDGLVDRRDVSVNEGLARLLEERSPVVTVRQMPEIKLTTESASRYRIVDYDTYLALAPGMALVKAAGHTPGSQMVYIALESGDEYLLIGDVAWHMDGVRLVRGKDAPWITEDEPAVLAQLRWLNGLSHTAPQIVIVASHDEEQHADLVRARLLSNGFELDGGKP